VAVTGSNGSGKTTLLRVVAGLLVPGRGRIEWSDGDGTLARGAARARLGLVSPELALYEDLTARENFAFFAAARGTAWRDADTDVWLERLGLPGRSDERLAGFSSGMKQRVKLAVALCGRPALVLLDEPGSNLDDAGRSALDALVREIKRTALVVVATNDATEAAWGDTRFDLGGGAR
jgi:heme exporter protein A